MSVVIFIEALKFIFPAYCANAIPVIAGGGFPIDFRKNFLDGRPIFGKNKTIRGFLFGLVFGTLVGIAESLFFENYPLYFGFILSLGALTGDLLGAFLKRRIGLKPGDLLPVVDQVDFILGAIIFSLFFYVSMVSSELVVAVLIVTPPLHLLTNYIAYKTGLKGTPW